MFYIPPIAFILSNILVYTGAYYSRAQGVTLWCDKSTCTKKIQYKQFLINKQKLLMRP